MYYNIRRGFQLSIFVGQPSTPTLPIEARDPWNKPSAPTSLKMSEVTKRSCTVKWSPPANDGGDMIRNYVVEYKVSGTFKWQRANEGDRTLETSYKVTGLHSDLDYEFRVAAENRAGVGSYSDTTLPVRAVDPVGKFVILSKLFGLLPNNDEDIEDKSIRFYMYDNISVSSIYVLLYVNLRNDIQF